MMSLRVRDICYTVVGKTINEVDIYKYNGEDIPVYSSSTSNNGLMGKIDKKYKDIFSSKGESGDLTWTTNGYAGTVFLRDTNFLMTEKCGKLVIKHEYIKKINSKWLEIYLNSVTKQYVTSQGGNGKLEKSQMDNIPVKLEDIELQNKIVEKYLKKQKLIESLKKSRQELFEQSKNIVKVNSGEIYKIKDIFYVFSGVRITEEQVYRYKGKIPCVTSQTTNEGIAWKGDENWLLKFSKKGRSLIIDDECITWTKDGVKAGTLFYRKYKFFPNDHCGVLIPKVAINLKWFIFNYQSYIYSKVAFKESQGMIYDEIMANLSVRIPDITMQDEIEKAYSNIIKRIKVIDKLINKLEGYELNL